MVLHQAASVANDFSMRCRIVAAEQIGTDDYGHALTTAPMVRDDDVPCMAWIITDKVETFSEQTQGSIEILRLAVGRNVDIDTDCIVSSVYNRLGTEIYSGPYRVTGVSRRADYQSVTARRVGGGYA